MNMLQTAGSTLGYAPTHVSSEDLLSYFVYAFELSWLNPAFKGKKDNMLSYLEGKIEREIPFHSDLSDAQKWWVYSLLMFQEIAEHKQAEYAIQTFKYLIQKSKELSEESLRIYTNMIHVIMAFEFPEGGIAIRPLEMETLKSSLVNNDELLKYFLGKKEEMRRVFKKHLSQKDLVKEYLDQILMKDRTSLRKFSDIWNAYYEIFIHMFGGVFEYEIVEDEDLIEKTNQQMKKLILAFLIASVKNKDKIEDLHDDMYGVIKDLVH